MNIINKQVANIPYVGSFVRQRQMRMRKTRQTMQRQRQRGKFSVIAYHNPLPVPCLVCSEQRLLQPSGKYKYIENIRPQESIIDANGRARMVTSIVPTRDYMGKLYITTKKSRNPVGIPRRNKILIQNTPKPDNNLIDYVFDVHSKECKSMIDVFQDNDQFLWTPSQNVVQNYSFVANVKINQHEDSLSVPSRLSFSHGFLIGAFLTCGCRCSNEKKSWTQFILDTKDTYFQNLLLLCLYNINQNQPFLSVWGVNNIENSEIQKLNVSSEYLRELVHPIEEGQRELPDSYTCVTDAGRDCLRGMYESILRTNHYYSNAHVYDLLMYLESLLGNASHHKTRGEVLTVTKHDRYPNHNDIIHILHTDTDEPFSSTICDHIPMASI